MSKITFNIGSGISTVQGVESVAIEIGSGKIKDVKIFDSNSLLVLFESSGKSNRHNPIMTS